MRRLTLLLATALLGAVAGCGQATAPTSDGGASRAIALSAAGTLVPGADLELGRTLAAARGRPVVVNVWASWCEPCRSEFPLLQRAARRFAGQVRFLGVDAGDDEADARAFLAEHPTPYAHISDPHGRAAMAMGAGRAMPTTIFYDADGERRHVAEGAYPTWARIAKDVDAYAIQ
jgi:thiol-disulfide isomerase/thioredoxin